MQRVGFSISGMLMGGTFTLSFGGNTTSGIAYNASAATVQSALEGLASIDSAAVVKTTDTIASQIWQVTFQGTLAGTNQNQISISMSGWQNWRRKVLNDPTAATP